MSRSKSPAGLRTHSHRCSFVPSNTRSALWRHFICVLERLITCLVFRLVITLLRTGAPGRFNVTTPSSSHQFWNILSLDAVTDHTLIRIHVTILSDFFFFVCFKVIFCHVCVSAGQISISLHLSCCVKTRLNSDGVDELLNYVSD